MIWFAVAAASNASIHLDHEDPRLGGAASVAMLASSLGADVTLAGVIRQEVPGILVDKNGRRIRRTLDTGEARSIIMAAVARLDRFQALPKWEA